MSISHSVDRPTYPQQICYDTAAIVPLIGADANHSLVIAAPRIIQVDTLPAATTLQVQQKIHTLAEWQDTGAVLAASAAHTVVFDHPPNYVQLVRTGSGAVKAYAQAAIID